MANYFPISSIGHRTCEICFDETGPFVSHCIDAAHVVHKKCIREWVFKNPEKETCPTCKKEINLASFFSNSEMQKLERSCEEQREIKNAITLLEDTQWVYDNSGHIDLHGAMLAEIQHYESPEYNSAVNRNRERAKCLCLIALVVAAIAATVFVNLD